MPKYRVQVEVSDLEELRKLLFPGERSVRAVTSGVYVVRAKTAVTAACRQVLLCRMDVAQTIIEGALEEIAEVARTTPYPEEEEANKALEIINKLAEKLGTDQTEAVNFCCKWMGKTKCQVQCT